MAASVETWQSYGALLARLCPSFRQALIAASDGQILWASDAVAAPCLQPTMGILINSGSNRLREIDGLADLLDMPIARFGFRIRGVLGEVLGLVLLELRPDTTAQADLATVHAQVKPALDCLQSELTARAAIGELHAHLADNSRNLELYRRLSEAGLAAGNVALAELTQIALEYLPGVFAAVLLPDRNLTICRTPCGHSREIEAGVLAQLHRHLLTRAQLHGCTLVANHLSIDGAKSPLPYKAISTPIHDELRRVVGVFAVFRQESAADFQLQDAELVELLARKAAQIVQTSFDLQTGLLTRAAFIAQTQAKIAAHAERAGAYGLLYVDIDQLNVVNENHGLPVGDEVIRSIAGLLIRRGHDDVLVARLTGDRFAMLVPAFGLEPAARIAEELRAAAVKLSGSRADKPLLVSLSIGVAGIGERDSLLEHALAAAELACRTAKERGRNRVEVFHGGVRGSVTGRGDAGLVAQVAAALACDSVELLAQPILPLGAIPANPRFEILLRMRATDGTRLSFESIMHPGSRPELARSIDNWVLEQSFERLAASRETLRQHPAKFSINVSGASLIDAQFWRMFEQLMRTSRLEPGSICCEFSEEALGGDIHNIAPFLYRMREQGVSFALDRFGAAAGSLSNLHALPVSALKIDGCFSRALLDSPRAQSTVRAITKLAQVFGLESICTHIETDSLRAKAAQLGVDFGQGFFIGQPMALDDAIGDLALYSCFATSTCLIDAEPLAAVGSKR